MHSPFLCDYIHKNQKALSLLIEIVFLIFELL